MATPNPSSSPATATSPAAALSLVLRPPRISKSARISLASLVLYLALTRLEKLIPLHLRDPPSSSSSSSATDTDTTTTTSPTPRLVRAAHRLLRLLALLSRTARAPLDAAATATRRLLDYFDEKSQAGMPLAPLRDLFSTARVESLMLAYLPTTPLAAAVQTGVFAVDFFVTSLLATGIASSGAVVVDGVRALVAAESALEEAESVRVRVDFLRRGHWCSRVNQHHVALQWLVSTQSKAHKNGLFRMVPFDTEFEDQTEDADIAKVEDFNMLPADEESYLDIQHEGFTFRVHFDYAHLNNSDKKKDDDANPTEPPILVQRIKAGPTSIQWMKDWLRRVSVEFVKYQKSKKRRSRYQYDFDSGDWQYIQTLHSSRGLASVALDKRDEDALMADLNTFLADKEFYKRMGLPWKRGYMFTGRPGTGKTSLINAISAHYNRDIYFMNLKEYDSDKQLQNAFSRVPKNCMIVFEDVDAQSRCVWNRQLRRKLERTEKIIGPMNIGEDDSGAAAVEDDEGDGAAADGGSVGSKGKEKAGSSKKKSSKKKKSGSKQEKKAKKAAKAAKKADHASAAVAASSTLLLTVKDEDSRSSSADSAIGSEGGDAATTPLLDSRRPLADAADTLATVKAEDSVEVDDADVVVRPASASGDSATAAKDASNDDEDEDSDDSDDDSDDESDNNDDESEPALDENGDEIDAATRKLLAATFGSATAIPPPPPPSENGPSLATLLNCLDGHSLAEGVMIVMTTNHPEVLDPAVIRPGRIDLHLDLGYCTRYQLQRMYKNVREDEAATLDGLDGVPEGVVAPCEAMRVMILHRRDPARVMPALREAADAAVGALQQQQAQQQQAAAAAAERRRVMMAAAGSSSSRA